MKKNPIFNFTKIIVNVHYYFAIGGSLIMLFFGFLRFVDWNEEIPKKDGKLLNLKGNYISIKANWDSQKEYFYEKNNEISPSYYLEKSQETGEFHIRNNEKMAIYVLFYSVLGAILYILIAYFLKEIFNSINKNQIFSNENAIRIRNIGLVLILGSLLSEFHSYILADYFKMVFKEIGKMKFETTTIGIRFDGTFYLGLLVLALSQIFKRGVELQEENELTV